MSPTDWRPVEKPFTQESFTVLRGMARLYGTRWLMFRFRCPAERTQSLWCWHVSDAFLDTMPTCLDLDAAVEPLNEGENLQVRFGHPDDETPNPF